MGFTYVKIIVCHPIDWEKQRETELLVDTGAIMSVIPRQILTDIGIRPVGRRKFRVFGGKSIERQVGGALLRYGDAFAIVQVAFGEEGDTSVLGATSLETLGFQVDPVTKKLKPIDLLLV